MLFRSMPTIFLHLGIFRPALLGNFQPAKVGKFQPAETGEYSTGVDSLRVITTLEFLQHHCSELGHRDLLVTHKISLSGVEMHDRPIRVASAARAASFKRPSGM